MPACHFPGHSDLHLRYSHICMHKRDLIVMPQRFAVMPGYSKAWFGLRNECSVPYMGLGL